jgi:hypothetical protein
MSTVSDVSTPVRATAVDPGVHTATAALVRGLGLSR